MGHYWALYFLDITGRALESGGWGGGGIFVERLVNFAISKVVFLNFSANLSAVKLEEKLGQPNSDGWVRLKKHVKDGF